MTKQDLLPDGLLELDQWICWRVDRRDGRDEKIPMQADREQIAKSTDPDTWSDYESAVETATEYEDFGLGFVFTEDDPFVGVDLDYCRDPETGEIDEWAQDIVDRLNSFTEVSPSGTGLHIIVRDVELPDWWTNQKDGEKEIEVYDSVRYFTVTIRPLEDAPIECRSPSEFEDWLREECDSKPRLTDMVDKPTGGSKTSHDVGELSVYDVVSQASYPPDERTSHPFHGSETGANFMVDEGGDTWRCWRHGVSGNAYHLIGIQHGIIDCGDWDPGGLSNRTWAEIFDVARYEGYDIPEPSDDDAHTIEADGGVMETSDGVTVEDTSGLTLPENESIDELNAREIAHYATNYLVRSETVVAMKDNGELYAYHDGVWEPNGEQTIRRMLVDQLESEYSQHIKREVIDRVRARKPRSRDDMGVPAGSVAVENGLLDLDEADIRPLRPDDNALWQMPVLYDEDADCPEFKEFLQEVCPEGDRPLLQEFVGYCLLHNNVTHEKALMLLGPTDAGKSVFLRVITNLFGQDNTANQSIQYIVNERWGLAELEGTPVNIRHDLDPEVIRKTGKAKEIISGNPMQAERKNQDPFEMQPTTKHIFSANRAPERNTDDEAFWNRWLTVVFPESIPREEQDPALIDSLTTDEELSGILNWAIEGYQRLTEQERFTNEPTPAENKERWEKFGSSVEQFLDAELTQDSEAQVAKDDVYKAYEEFASQQGMEVVTKSKLTRELKKKDGISKGQVRDDEGERIYVYKGIRLSEDSVEEEEAE